VRDRLHRNSQKRIYVDQGIYFITTNTYQSFPFFSRDIFCELFIAELELCQKLKGFTVYGYKINPQHIHLLIQTGEKFDFSNVMHFLKRNFSQNANKMVGDVHQRRRCASSPLMSAFDDIVEKYKRQFTAKYGIHHKIPPFKWQKSFHFHVVNNQKDFTNHLRYIDNQWIKHELKENKFCFIAPTLF